MKKATMKSLLSYLDGQTITNIDEIRAEIAAELARDEKRAQANRELYAEMHDIVLAHLSSTPVTVTELYEEVKTELPEGATKSKIQYALRALWANEINARDNGRGPRTYTKK